VGKAFDGDANVVVAKCDADGHRDVAAPYDVKGYPTIKFFPKNNKAGEDYNGGREASDFVTFLNERAGSERALGGGYLETAGRIPSLDALAAQFVASSGDAKTQRELMAQAVAAANRLPNDHKNKEYAKVYEATMKKILEKGASFASTESARLKRVLASGSVSSKKVADFSKRANIIAQFAASTS